LKQLIRHIPAHQKLESELEYDECTEDQCFALIQQILQVDNLFLFNMTGEGNFTQLSLTRVDLDSKRLVRTSSCADCNIEQLNTKVEELVMKLIAEDQIAIDGTKITPEPKPDPEPAVEPEKSTSSEKNLFANSEKKRVRFDCLQNYYQIGHVFFQNWRTSFFLRTYFFRVQQLVLDQALVPE
jgi:hypothetical protein